MKINNILQGNCVPSENIRELSALGNSAEGLVFTALLTVTGSERAQVLLDAAYKVPSDIFWWRSPILTSTLPVKRFVGYVG
jgi:hypothetical protein